MPDHWSTRRKNHVEYMLSKGICYISSEESDMDSDGKKTLRRKSLPWLKKKYAKSFRQLDDLHYSNLSMKSKHMMYTRIDSPERSVRKHPQDIPKPLLVQNENSDL